MADSVTVKVTGLAEIQRKLLELPNRVNNNVVRRSLWAGAAVFRTEARNKAPLWTGDVSAGHPPPGTLKRSIVAVHAPERSAPGYYVTLVVVRHGTKFQHQGASGNVSQDAYYWHFVEFGTVNMSARPFMRPAFELQKVAAKDKVINTLENGVFTEAAKL